MILKMVSETIFIHIMIKVNENVLAGHFLQLFYRGQSSS